LKQYNIQFKFDAEGEPPKEYIVDQQGTAVVEVFEEPTLLTPEWSWNEEDWRPGSMITEWCAFMNSDDFQG
jgi:hypothetical protein